MTPWLDIDGDTATGVLLIADHASARVPDGIDLRVADMMMGEHVAIDLGVAPLAERLCARLRCPAVLGNVSRLVIDLNREMDAAALVPSESDGRVIPGNADLPASARADRVARYWRPYHDHIAARIATDRPRLLVSLHSFTPALRLGGPPRPWPVGILYNRDERAARIAIPALAAGGMLVGDNQPYSGRVLNATMDRHGEGNAIPYLGIEVRQDQIADESGLGAWTDRLVATIERVMGQLGSAAG